MNLELENKLSQGLAFCGQQAWQDAAQAFEDALALDPLLAIAWNNLGNVRDELNERPASIAAYQQALAIQPDYANAKTNLAIVAHKHGTALYQTGDLGGALKVFEIAVAQSPSPRRADYDHSYLQLLLETCAHAPLTQLAAQMQAATEADPLYRPHPYPLLAAADAPLWHKEAAKRHLARLCEEAGLPLESPSYAATAPYPPADKIRIAYLSSDWHQHPVPQQLLPTIEAHDRSRFAVIGIATDGIADTSAWRLRIEQAFDQFLPLGHLSDAQIAQAVHDLQVDIAIDLSLYMEGGRPLILAYRPAPIQIAFLGYAGTSSAPWLDYVIADNITIPPELEDHHCERILRMPRSFMPDNNQRPDVCAVELTQADRAAARIQQGLPAHGFVFCAFSNPYKISPAMLSCWFELLHAVPGSVLWLQAHNPWSELNLKRAARQAGLPIGRIVFARRMPSFADHLARYRLADVFLDTFSYNAHVTAADALWSGLPVITLQGESFASRVASSILTALDLPELITTSITHYQQLARDLAAQPKRLRELRRRVAHARIGKGYFDQVRYARDLEGAFISILDAQNHIHTICD